MTITVITASDTGAPELSAVNGRLCDVLDWALPQAGWTIEHSAGNARVYRSVNGRFLHVNHDSAVSGNAIFATVRGCEGATTATDLINPYPDPSQVIDGYSVWYVGSGTGSRDYRLYVLDDFFIFQCSRSASDIPNLAGDWDGGFFGQLLPTYDSDAYCSAIWVRGTSSTSTNNGFNSTTIRSGGFTQDGSTFYQRDVTGAVLSSRGSIQAMFANSSARVGSDNSFFPPQAGYQGRILRAPAFVTCLGSSVIASGAMQLFKRGAIPQLWCPLHSSSGPLNTANTFRDVSYHPDAVFRPLTGAPGSNNPWWIIEETDTWRPY